MALHGRCPAKGDGAGIAAPSSSTTATTRASSATASARASPSNASLYRIRHL